jgi:hypothetical protein
MTSAAARVFAIPELLEMILLCLPVRKQDGRKPDFHVYVLQRVNKAFNEAINRPSMALHRLLRSQPDKSKEKRFDYKIPCWLSKEHLWPSLYLAKVRKHSGIYLFEPLDVWIRENGVAHTYDRKVSPGERFTRPEASWRKLPLHPTAEVKAVFSVNLFDTSKRLTDDVQECALSYSFYSGGEWPSLTVGDLCDFMRMIRSFTAEQHIWFSLQATVQRLHRLQAHLAAYEEIDGVIKAEKRPAACQLCSCTRPSRLRCDICEHMARHVSRTCEVGYRCRVRDCRVSKTLTIFWPMNRELFDRIGVIDRQGRAIINQ